MEYKLWIFLKNRNYFYSFENEWKAPVIKERFNKSASCFHVSFFRRNNILSGILISPEVCSEM